MAIPEISYGAIKLVARFPVSLPIVSGLVMLALLIAPKWPAPSPVAWIIGIVTAAVTAFAVRLLVEIVVVLADTLLPR